MPGYLSTARLINGVSEVVYLMRLFCNWKFWFCCLVGILLLPSFPTSQNQQEQEIPDNQIILFLKGRYCQDKVEIQYHSFFGNWYYRPGKCVVTKDSIDIFLIRNDSKIQDYLHTTNAGRLLGWGDQPQLIIGEDKITLVGLRQWQRPVLDSAQLNLNLWNLTSSQITLSNDDVTLTISNIFP